MSLRRVLFAALTAAAILPAALSPALAADPAPAKPAAAKVAPPVIKVYEKWSTRCDPSLANPKVMQCHAFTDTPAEGMKNPPKDGKLFYIGISNVARKGVPETLLFVVTPLGTILPPGVGISIDDKVTLGAPFSFCLQLGCQAEMLLTPEQLTAIKTGKQLQLLFRLVGQGDLKIPVSLEGAGKALATLPKAAVAKAPVKK